MIQKIEQRCWWVEKELKVLVGQGARRAYSQIIHPPTYPTLPRWAGLGSQRGKGGGKKWSKKETVQKLGQNLVNRST